MLKRFRDRWTTYRWRTNSKKPTRQSNNWSYPINVGWFINPLNNKENLTSNGLTDRQRDGRTYVLWDTLSPNKPQFKEVYFVFFRLSSNNDNIQFWKFPNFILAVGGCIRLPPIHTLTTSKLWRYHLETCDTALGVRVFMFFP